MEFTSSVSSKFRIMIAVTLTWQILYIITNKYIEYELLFNTLLKLAVCFTAYISYLNDTHQYLVIKERSITIEDIETKKIDFASWRFLYIIIGIVYNPFISLFETKILWIICNILTVLFFAIKSKSLK